MIGAALFSPAHRRMRDSGVLVVLVWVAFHLLGCAHSHGPAFDSPHSAITTAYAAETLAPAAVAAPGGEATVSSPGAGTVLPGAG